jgi:phosphatidylglycerophosphatase C
MQKPIIAAFDFDGTLTYRDTLFSFLLFVKGPLKTALYLFLKLPILIGYVFGGSSRQGTKESILKIFFSGTSLAELSKQGEAFAAGPLDRHLKPEAMERLQWHVKQGHRCILISASLAIYLNPWAKRHGFSDVIASELEAENGVITGRLEGLNCWGAEKTRRLKEKLGAASYTLYAYGNSRGDKELLETANYPFYKTFR